MDGKLDKWTVRWLPAIKSDLQDLVWSVGIYKDLVEVVRENPQIDVSNRFYGWLGLTFAQSTAMGIRRQTDDHKDVVSLMRLSRDIAENCENITKEFFLSLYSEDQADLAATHWARLAGSEVSTYPYDRAIEHVERLGAVRGRVAEYVDRRIAHLEDRSIASTPTFAVLLDSIDDLESCFKHFGLLLHAISYKLSPVVQYDWKSIFREPWIRPE